MKRPTIPFRQAPKFLLIINSIAALIYISWWFNFSHIGSPIVYGLLLFGELYHLAMAYTFWFTVWPAKSAKKNTAKSPDYFPTVDIFVPMVSEPIEVVRKTLEAAIAIDYPHHHVYLLNDGFVAQKSNWEEAERLASELNITCITRKKPGGAKAGNINFALSVTHSEYIAIFDSDMVPHPDFLKKTVPYFIDEKMGFVQTPQYYQNYKINPITSAAWDQQKIFFGPILRGKQNSNSAFICGTNIVIRRKALEQVGGMYEKSIAEDFLTSLLIHNRGWYSHYVPEVLVEGLAPEDLLSYYKQQYRWARGSLEVLFGQNPLFKEGLSLGQKIQYLSSALYYFNGPVVAIDMSMPLIFLFFGIQAVTTTTTSFAVYFIPFMFLNMYTLYFVTNSSLTFRALAFSYSSFYLQLTALRSLLLKERVTFSVTPKAAQTGNFLFLAFPQIAYVIVSFIGFFVGIYREGFNPSVLTNIAWAIFNIALFLPFVNASH